jgi:hypothetical protein
MNDRSTSSLLKIAIASVSQLDIMNEELFMDKRK